MLATLITSLTFEQLPNSNFLMVFALIASIWMPHVIFRQDYTEISNMAYRGNVLSFPYKVRLCLSKHVFWVLYSEIVWFVYMPVCNSLFCPPGVSLLLRTSTYTNLKMIWHTWSSKKNQTTLYGSTSELADQCVGNISEAKGTWGIYVIHISWQTVESDSPAVELESFRVL